MRKQAHELIQEAGKPYVPTLQSLSDAKKRDRKY